MLEREAFLSNYCERLENRVTQMCTIMLLLFVLLLFSLCLCVAPIQIKKYSHGGHNVSRDPAICEHFCSAMFTH